MNKKLTRKHLYLIVSSILSICLIVCAIFMLNKTELTILSKTKYEGVEIAEKPIPEITIAPAVNEQIGTFYYPKVEVEVPLLYGYDEVYMANYTDEVGLEDWNNFPGQDNKIYINGHRHLAFQNLKHIEVGDIIILKMTYGEFTYEVTKDPLVVLASDKEAVDFYFNDRDTEYTPQILRLQTCYPFEAGSTLDHRYLVDLVLTKSVYYYS